MQYQMIYSKRKTICITVNKQGKVIVTCPVGCSHKKVEEFVMLKQNWIKKHLSRVQAILENPLAKPYTACENQIVLLLGKPIKICYSNNSVTSFDNNNLYLPIKSKDKLSCLKKFYIEKANLYLQTRLQKISTLINIPYNKLKVTGFKCKWGSCSSSHEIKLNFKLILLAPQLIDYVIIHELCHINHQNHKKSFWQEVGKFCPNYSECRKLIKENNFIVHII